MSLHSLAPLPAADPLQPLLVLSQVGFTREGFTLEVAALALQPGTLYHLHGANGAGKSTLLHLLALLLVPSQGVMRYCGEAITSAGQRLRLRRQITLVEQQPYLFAGTVAENLAFGLRLRDVHGDLQRQRIARALQMVGLEGFAGRRVRQLSGGESRRVALARALVLRPQLLLLDEPTGGLDQASHTLFEECLAALPAQGTTVVLASHDTDQLTRLGGQRLYVESGRLFTCSAAPAALAKENV